MGIGPIEYNGAIQRSQDVQFVNKAEEAKPIVDQQMIQAGIHEHESRMANQVVGTNESTKLYDKYREKKKEQKKKEEKNLKKGACQKMKNGEFDVRV